MADFVRNRSTQQLGIVDSASPRDGTHLLVEDGRHLSRQRDRVDDRHAKLEARAWKCPQLKRASTERGTGCDLGHDSDDEVPPRAYVLTARLCAGARAVPPFNGDAGLSHDLRG